MVKESGYDGMGMLWLDRLPDFLQAFDSEGLKVPQIYLNVDFTLGQIHEVSFGGAPFDPRLKQDLPLLKGRCLQLIFLPCGFRPADPIAYGRSIQIIREIADLVGTNAQVLLSNTGYLPYANKVEDVLRLADDTGRSNVLIMFDLLGYLKESKHDDYRQLLARAMPRLKAVAVVGTDEFPVPTKPNYLKPLGRGSFDMLTFLETLRELGYTGPVLLETTWIDGNREYVLKESMQGWRKLQSQLSLKP
jgi:sugar phosphate isomerase/epimerase